MKKLLPFIGCGLITVIFHIGTARGSDEVPIDDGSAVTADDTALAHAAQHILERYCFRCHGVEFKRQGLDLFDRPALLRPAEQDASPYLVPREPQASRLWKAVDSGMMPPKQQPQPTPDEKETVRLWIEAGALVPPEQRAPREYSGEDTILQMIDHDLENLRGNARVSARYFSVAHLWNDPAISQEQLRIYRAAAVQVLLEQSRGPRVAVPRIIDSDARLLAIDLRDYGWTDRDDWEPLLKKYPYGLTRSTELAEQVYDITDCELPYVRVDWFVYHASRRQRQPDDDNAGQRVDVRDPIARTRRDYARPLSIDDAARELGLPATEEVARRLGIPSADQLAAVIRSNEPLRQAGLLPLAEGETIPRVVWEQAFQKTGRMMKLGVPLQIK